jgi:hypothetical protein
MEAFVRSFGLPEDANGSKVTADYNDAGDAIGPSRFCKGNRRTKRAERFVFFESRSPI